MTDYRRCNVCKKVKRLGAANFPPKKKSAGLRKTCRTCLEKYPYIDSNGARPGNAITEARLDRLRLELEAGPALVTHWLQPNVS